ncbi:MAG: AbrB/MazE/SpoVT family DNA-binding domain-containing protein [bacterium]
MTKKISRYGENGILILDKSLLDSLKITEKTNLEITSDGKSIIITPKGNREKNIISKNKKLQKLYEKNIKKYSSTLKKLAKQ